MASTPLPTQVAAQQPGECQGKRGGAGEQAARTQQQHHGQAARRQHQMGQVGGDGDGGEQGDGYPHGD